MASKLDILVNLLRKGIKPDPSLIGRYGLPQYTDRSSGNVLGRSTEQPTYQQQLFKQPVNTAILNAVTNYGADIIEDPVQTLAIDPAVAAVKTPEKTLKAFGDLTSASLQRATGIPYQQKLESGLTSFAEAAGGAAEVVGVGLPIAKAGAKPFKASLNNLLTKNPNTLQPNPNTLQPKPISISDEIAEQVGTADEVTPVVDDAVDATQELMPPSRIADDVATTTPFANETTKSMQETYGYLQKQSGMKPKEFKEFLENARTDPESAEMLFNINDEFIVLARGFGQIPETSAVIAKAVKQQNINQGKRISKSFDIALGNPDTAFQTVKKINTALKKQASPIYEQAYKQGINMTQGLQDVMSIPLMAKYEKSTLKRLKDRNLPTTNKLKVLHEVKRKLDGDIGRAIVSNDKTETADLLELKNQLLEQIDLASPTYKKARKVFSDEMENLEALEYGSKNIFKSDVGPEEFAEEIAEYSKAELESLRVGIKKAIRKVEAGKPETYNAIDRKFILPNTRAKLEVAIGKDAADNLYDSLDAEQTMFRQSSSVDPGDNSRTNLNKEASIKTRKGLQPLVQRAATSGSKALVDANGNLITAGIGAVGNLSRKGLDVISGSINVQVAEKAADILTRPANEGIDILLAAAPEEKVGIAREIISQTQGKPVTPLKRKAIEVLSAQALNPEMQNIARGLGGAGAVSATSNDEPNVLSNILAAPVDTTDSNLPIVTTKQQHNKLQSGQKFRTYIDGKLTIMTKK